MQQLMVSRDGYNYVVIKGFIADPRTWPQEHIMRAAIEQIDDHQSLKSWVDSMYGVVKLHCGRPGAEFDRIWFPMVTYWDQALAFFLRPSRTQRAVRDIPVYRLQSCILTTTSKAQDVLALPDQLLEAEGIKSTKFLAREEFCLE